MIIDVANGFGRHMNRKRALSAMIAAAIPLAVGGEPLAQVGNGSQSEAPPTYRQSFGDLMTMTIQPRHVKLGLAGQQGNWTYAW
jgi:hypothetical protein